MAKRTFQISSKLLICDDLHHFVMNDLGYLREITETTKEKLPPCSVHSFKESSYVHTPGDLEAAIARVCEKEDKLWLETAINSLSKGQP